MRRWLGILIALASMGCGGEMESISLELGFQPRDLPTGTQRLRFYVLHSVLSDQSQAMCEDFIGSSAPKQVLDYPSDIVETGSTEVSDITGATVVVDELAPGGYMFYLEATNASSQLVGCGCGMGNIIKGQKTVITIRIVTDCSS